MRIAIFGATGGTGQELVKQAIEKGHSVSVLVRNPAKLTNKNVRIIQGDVRNKNGVSKNIEGADVVISALGVKPGQQPICELGVRNMIAAMQTHNVQRIIVESVYGAGKPRAGMYATVLRFMIPRLIRDKEGMENTLQQSNIAWTIVRPTVLANGPKIGKVTHGTNFAPRGLFPSISRADVAGFMLKQIETNEYIKKTVNITEK